MFLNSRFLRYDLAKVGGVVLLAIVTLFALVTTSVAQRLTGSARMEIQDPSGAAVPGAKATLTSKAKGTRLDLVAGENGVVVVPDLAPDDYSVAVQHEGFKTLSTVLTIRVGSTSSLTLRMELGSVSTEVMVRGVEETVDTVKSTVQGIIQTEQIDSLPLNGRNFLDLAQLSPGVQIVDGGQFDPTKNQMVGVSVGGRGGRVTRIQMDGVDITDETVGTTLMNLTNESIQEFSIAQSSLDVSTDLTSSGAVNIITRSGGNTMHGSGFGFFRRSDFAASTESLGSPAGTAKPAFSRDNYGGRLGGAIIKNKLFFDAEYEKLQQQSSNTTNVSPFPQFTGSFGVPVTEHMGGGRIDYNLTDRNKLFYRFTHDDNIGVTGFGGVGLSAFANSNSTNSHVVGWDHSGGNFVHSVRFSVLKFINGIVDANALAGTPILPVQVNVTGLGGFLIGPNANAPQSTYQRNRQGKYDGTWVHGSHTVQFGGEYNRVDQNGAANFFGLGPRIVASFSTGVSADPFNANGASDPLNYQFRLVDLGNGLGALSEKPSLGFPFGGFTNNRLGFYVHDNWRVSRKLTINAGLRYDHDDGLTNSDLGRTPGIAQFDPELGGHPKNDNKRFAPQVGFAWNLNGDGKTVIRGGGGIYYDTNIFNNLSFDRQINLPPGFGNAVSAIQLGVPFTSPDPNAQPPNDILFDFEKDCTNAQPSLALPDRNSCYGAALGTVIPFVLQAQAKYQQVSAQLASTFSKSGPTLFDAQGGVGGGSIIDPNYKSPYGAQMNIGIQREIKPGLVFSADYIMNRGVHFYETVDRNRVGAARFLDAALAQAAMTATFQLAKFPGCNTGNNATSIDCVIAHNGTINDFANNGVGAGSALDGSAFTGVNENFRTMDTIEYVGLSRYSALQAALTGRLGNWGPFRNATTNITYALSRFNSSSTDQDFLFAAINNDNPTDFYGPSNLDRTHQFGFSFITDLPFHFRLASTTSYRSNEASIGIFEPSGANAAAEIFISDYNGDGTIGDPIPGTKRGEFGRSVTNATQLNKILSNYNSTVAGTLTPAGKALVGAGLFTQAQLTSLGGVAATLDPTQFSQPGQINNPNFYTTDIRLSWRYSIGEKLTIEPVADIFNIFNRMNGVGTGSDGRGGNTALDGTLSGAAGSITNTQHLQQRVGAGSGSFSSGLPRAFQFGIRVSF